MHLKAPMNTFLINRTLSSVLLIPPSLMLEVMLPSVLLQHDFYCLCDMRDDLRIGKSTHIVLPGMHFWGLRENFQHSTSHAIIATILHPCELCDPSGINPTCMLLMGASAVRR